MLNLCIKRFLSIFLAGFFVLVGAHLGAMGRKGNSPIFDDSLFIPPPKALRPVDAVIFTLK